MWLSKINVRISSIYRFAYVLFQPGSNPARGRQSQDSPQERTKAQLSTAGTDNKRPESAQFVADHLYLAHYWPFTLIHRVFNPLCETVSSFHTIILIYCSFMRTLLLWNFSMWYEDEWATVGSSGYIFFDVNKHVVWVCVLSRFSDILRVIRVS